MPDLLMCSMQRMTCEIKAGVSLRDFLMQSFIQSRLISFFIRLPSTFFFSQAVRSLIRTTWTLSLAVERLVSVVPFHT